MQISTQKVVKRHGGNTQKATRKINNRDLSKIRKGRQLCYCQCTKHPLVNNCVNCGKIVCEQEGEGPCLFCGTWVDRDAAYDVRELVGLGIDDNEQEEGNDG